MLWITAVLLGSWFAIASNIGSLGNVEAIRMRVALEAGVLLNLAAIGLGDIERTAHRASILKRKK